MLWVGAQAVVAAAVVVVVVVMIEIAALCEEHSLVMVDFGAFDLAEN